MSNKLKRKEVRSRTQEIKEYLSEIIEYDILENPIIQEEYTPEGEIELRIHSSYDSKGNLIEQKQTIENGELADHKIFHRNDSGKVIRTEIFFQDGSKSIVNLIKDPEKNTEEHVEVDEDGELESRELNYLNENKQIILKETYSYENKLTEAFKYEYNQKGMLIRRDQLDQRKKLFLYTEYEYDEYGRTVFRANRNRKGKISEFLKVDYDDKGQVIKQNFSGKYFFIFEYDQKGNTVLEERYDAENQLEYQSRFEYDENNRLTREVNLEFTREITYQYHEE